MAEHAQTASRSPFGPALVYGFGSAVAMWLLGFVTHLPGIQSPSWLVGVLLIGCQLGFGILAGRDGAGHGPVRVGLLSGLVCGLLNLLILGGVLAPEDPEHGLPAGWLGTVGAFLAYSMVSSGLGGVIGGLISREPSPARPSGVWLSKFAWVAALGVVPVLFSGGLVTSHEAGLAVPDWPNSYGSLMFLYPVSRMTGGIYYEHAHRLFGSLAGMGVIALVVFVFVADRRAWVRWSAAFALGAVIVQGVLGGVGVAIADGNEGWRSVAASAAQLPATVPADFALTTDNTLSASMRMIHGITGQMTFAWIVIIAAFLSLHWRETTWIEPSSDRLIRKLGAALMIVLTLQLTLGAASRHFQHFHIAMTHLFFALAVILVGLACAFRAYRFPAPLPLLGRIFVVLLVLQVILGFATLFLVLPYESPASNTLLSVLIATLHQATGAGIYATGALLLCWGYRMTARASAEDVSRASRTETQLAGAIA